MHVFNTSVNSEELVDNYSKKQPHQYHETSSIDSDFVPLPKSDEDIYSQLPDKLHLLEEIHDGPDEDHKLVEIPEHPHQVKEPAEHPYEAAALNRSADSGKSLSEYTTESSDFDGTLTEVPLSPSMDQSGWKLLKESKENERPDVGQDRTHLDRTYSIKEHSSIADRSNTAPKTILTDAQPAVPLKSVLPRFDRMSSQSSIDVS